ncbi:ribbon-helix-helix protein, CopG family [Bacillus sp. AFS017336]|nr:ribbon-helix-helix protein, CopG family [Bacillus sp. AFS017336]PEL13217.1 hypothetical protein CN601_05005 [Bacillus sp. AFS017336]
MAIKSTKGAITISLDKEVIDKLREEAEKNHRTVSNQIAFIISEYERLKG